MNGKEQVLGMVLSATPYGEYDKRLVILTKEYGKITAFAKGARRASSSLLGCSQAFAFGTFHVIRGRSSYTLLAAEISNYFAELREDLEAIYYGFYFCEFADYLSRENVDGTEILKLLYQSFRALVKKPVSFLLIRYIFEMKIMTINGEAPMMFSCVKCGKKESFHMVSVENGGVLCEECRGKGSGVQELSAGLRYTLQFIITSGIEKLYTFDVTEAVREELGKFLASYLQKYAPFESKSLAMIENLTLQIEGKSIK